MKGVVVTRVFPGHASGSWALVQDSPQDWRLVPGELFDLEGELAALFDAPSVDVALELARVVQRSFERKGRAALRHVDDVAVRLPDDFSARLFADLVKERNGR